MKPIKLICCSHLHVAGALWVEAAVLIFHVSETCEVVGVDVRHVNLEKGKRMFTDYYKLSYNLHLNNYRIENIIGL